MHLQPADKKWGLHCATTRLYNPKLFALQLGAPLANRKAFSGSCEQRYFTPLESGEDSASCSKALLWMMRSWELARGLSCPGKHWANSLYKSLEVHAYKLLWRGPHKNEAAATELTAFHSWLTPTQWPDQRQFACRQTAWEMFMSHD